MACNSSSNIASGVSTLNANKEASRLIITIAANISNDIGIGDVIRYDTLGETYVLSSASGLVESEVVGIVESINPNLTKNVVIYGSINLPESYLLFDSEDPTGADGGNELFFLSNIQSGKLQNIAPTTAPSVIKSIYQISPHGSYTGIVINNIGYALGGEIPTTFTGLVAGDNDVGFVTFYIISDNDTTFDLYPFALMPKVNQKYYIVKNTHEDFYNKFDRKFGFIEDCVLSAEFVLSDSIATTYGKIWEYNPTNTTISSGVILSNTENSLEIEKSSHAIQQITTKTVSDGQFSYWLQDGPIFLGSNSGGVISNSSAYDRSPITFSTSNISKLSLPIVSFNSSLFVLTSNNYLINFITNPLHGMEFRYIIKKEGTTSSASLPSFSFVNNTIIESLIVDGININDKLLELENRLSYLESRLTM